MKRIDLIRQLEQAGSVFIRTEADTIGIKIPRLEPVSQFQDTVKSETISPATFSAK